MIALVLAAAVAASDAPLGAVDMAATAAKVQADIKRMCPWVPIKVVECNNALPCSCTASGVPVDVCKQSL